MCDAFVCSTKLKWNKTVLVCWKYKILASICWLNKNWFVLLWQFCRIVFHVSFWSDIKQKFTLHLAAPPTPKTWPLSQYFLVDFFFHCCLQLIYNFNLINSRRLFCNKILFFSGKYHLLENVLFLASSNASKRQLTSADRPIGHPLLYHPLSNEKKSTSFFN